MKETRDLPTVAIASLSTGILLCDFNTMVKAAEFLMGHLIFTHEFASKDLCKKIKETILEQYPEMPTELNLSQSDWREHAERLKAQFGSTVKITGGKNDGYDD